MTPGVYGPCLWRGTWRGDELLRAPHDPNEDSLYRPEAGGLSQRPCLAFLRTVTCALRCLYAVPTRHRP